MADSRATIGADGDTARRATIPGTTTSSVERAGCPGKARPTKVTSAGWLPPVGSRAGPGMPLPFRLLLAAAVLALGVAVLLVAGGGLGQRRLRSRLDVRRVRHRHHRRRPCPARARRRGRCADLSAPDEPYTNQPTVDLVGTVPAAVAGDRGSRIRIYLAIGDGDPGVVTEVPIGASQHFLVPEVDAEPRHEHLHRHDRRPDRPGERTERRGLTYVLDTTKPKITVSSPKSQRPRQRGDRQDRGPDPGAEHAERPEQHDERDGRRRGRRQGRLHDRGPDRRGYQPDPGHRDGSGGERRTWPMSRSAAGVAR